MAIPALGSAVCILIYEQEENVIPSCLVKVCCFHLWLHLEMPWKTTGVQLVLQSWNIF